MNDYKITALYARLSSDDMQEGDRNSIIHQKAILQEYAINNGFSNRQFYVDDGWSGTSFNRPDFKRMLADVESGIIDTIIVKDLSRFGRENNMAGMYIETILPQKDVRFISIEKSQIKGAVTNTTKNRGEIPRKCEKAHTRFKVGCALSFYN